MSPRPSRRYVEGGQLPVLVGLRQRRVLQHEDEVEQVGVLLTAAEEAVDPAPGVLLDDPHQRLAEHLGEVDSALGDGAGGTALEHRLLAGGVAFAQEDEDALLVQIGASLRRAATDLPLEELDDLAGDLRRRSLHLQT